MRTARRFSLCPDDAQDAYQRTLEIFMAHADRLDHESVAGWLHVVVKREAQSIRRSRQRFVTSSEVDFDRYESGSTPTPDERLASFDLVGRAAEALKRLKPQELRALWLKAQGVPKRPNSEPGARKVRISTGTTFATFSDPMR